MGIYDRDYYQGDRLRPLRPWDNRSMVTLLIIANVAVFVLNYLFSSGSSDSLGLMRFVSLFPENAAQPWQWFRFVTYGFAHAPGQITHILFNMLALYFLGRNVEDKYGKWEFLRFYLISIALGGIVWSIRNFGVNSGPLLGASGGVTAVSMLFVFSFPQATLYLYGIVPVKAWLLGVLIVVGNFFGSRDFVAYDVHLVGAAFATAYFFANWNFAFLGTWSEQLQTRIKQQQRGLKVHRPDSTEATAAPNRDEIESDRILDKIHREGKDSLTSRERNFLERYSRQMREKRKQL